MSELDVKLICPRHVNGAVSVPPPGSKDGEVTLPCCERMVKYRWTRGLTKGLWSLTTSVPCYTVDVSKTMSAWGVGPGGP